MTQFVNVQCFLILTTSAPSIGDFCFFKWSCFPIHWLFSVGFTSIMWSWNFVFYVIWSCLSFSTLLINCTFFLDPACKYLILYMIRLSFIRSSNSFNIILPSVTLYHRYSIPYLFMIDLSIPKILQFMMLTIFSQASSFKPYLIIICKVQLIFHYYRLFSTLPLSVSVSLTFLSISLPHSLSPTLS